LTFRPVTFELCLDEGRSDSQSPGLERNRAYHRPYAYHVATIDYRIRACRVRARNNASGDRSRGTGEPEGQSEPRRFVGTTNAARNRRADSDSEPGSTRACGV